MGKTIEDYIIDLEGIPFLGTKQGLYNLAMIQNLGNPAVESTVKAGITLKGFDFYFDYVVDKCRVLEALWND